MSQVRIIPDYVADSIYAALDRALLKCPEAVKDKQHLYQQLLQYYDEHGCVPVFDIVKNHTNQRTNQP